MIKIAHGKIAETWNYDFLNLCQKLVPSEIEGKQSGVQRIRLRWVRSANDEMRESVIF